MKRRRRYQREEGRLIALAFNEPDKIDDEFADPVTPAEPGETIMETERWW